MFFLKWQVIYGFFFKKLLKSFLLCKNHNFLFPNSNTKHSPGVLFLRIINLPRKAFHIQIPLTGFAYMPLLGSADCIGYPATLGCRHYRLQAIPGNLLKEKAFYSLLPVQFLTKRSPVARRGMDIMLRPAAGRRGGATCIRSVPCG